MKIWGQKIYDSNVIQEANFAVKGYHKELGSGVLTLHKIEWRAKYNTMLINADGGFAEVIPYKSLHRRMV